LNLSAAVIDLGAQSSTGNRPVRESTVTWGTTLSALGIRLGVRTDDLVRLNPNLARNPYVPAGTRVRYPTGVP
jgi:hypothetical protein